MVTHCGSYFILNCINMCIFLFPFFATILINQLSIDFYCKSFKEIDKFDLSCLKGAHIVL